MQYVFMLIAVVCVPYLAAEEAELPNISFNRLDIERGSSEPAWAYTERKDWLSPSFDHQAFANLYLSSPDNTACVEPIEQAEAALFAIGDAISVPALANAAVDEQTVAFLALDQAAIPINASQQGVEAWNSSYSITAVAETLLTRAIGEIGDTLHEEVFSSAEECFGFGLSTDVVQAWSGLFINSMALIPEPPLYLCLGLAATTMAILRRSRRTKECNPHL